MTSLHELAKLRCITCSYTTIRKYTPDKGEKWQIFSVLRGHLKTQISH